MHRSGTSCLTGSLQEAGLYLGDHHTWNPYNLKGNRENQFIVDINDSVLAANGAAWDRPPSGPVRWSEQAQHAARELFARYAAQSPFGFKDPRTLLVLDGWRDLFPHMQFIGIFRHPVAVAASLRNRNGMPHEQGLDLWYEYNRRLLRVHTGRPFPVLCFDEAPDDFQEKLYDVLKEMGFDAAAWRGEFFDEALRSAESGERMEIPWRVRRLHRKLQKLAI